MKHFLATFRGDRALDEIHAAVGQDGGMVTRIHEEEGETRVYFAGGEGGGEHLRKQLGAEVREVGEEEVTKIG